MAASVDRANLNTLSVGPGPITQSPAVERETLEQAIRTGTPAKLPDLNIEAVA